MKSKPDYLFNVFLAFAPILSMYKSPIPGFNMAEVLLVIFVITFLYNKYIIIRCNSAESVFLCFTAYTIILTTLQFVAGKVNNAELFRMIRFCFYYITICLWIKAHLKKEIFVKWTNIIAFSSIAFLIYQYVLYYGFGRVQLGVISQDLLYFDGYRNRDFEIFFEHSFRPSSFFSEPAYMTQFLCMPLIVALFDKETENLKTAGVCLLGMLLSTAGQAIVLAAEILIFYVAHIIHRIIRKGVLRSDFIKGLFLVILFCIVLITVPSSDLFQNSLSRLTDVGTNSASEARLSVYRYLFQIDNTFHLLFGHGFGTVPSEGFIPGFAYVFYGTGIVGVILISLFSILVWLKGSLCAKCMLVIFVTTFMATSVFMNIMVICYMCLLLEKKTVSNFVCSDDVAKPGKQYSNTMEKNVYEG